MKGKMIYLEKARQTSLREFEIPRAAPGAAVLEILCASVCGSDLHIWDGIHPSPSFRQDFHMGHEGIAKIVELGEGLDRDNAGNPVKVGDRVVFAYFPTCMSCPACLRGRYDACMTGKKAYAPSPLLPPHFTGTFGTHMYLLPNQFFYKVPDEIPDKIAASANCALAQVYFSLDRADLQNGEWILIQGAGGLGLHACALAKAKGAKVIVVGSGKDRLALAKRFGADFCIDKTEFSDMADRISKVKELTGGIGVDVALEVSGNANAFVEGIRSLAVAGRYVAIGIVSETERVEIAPAEFIRKSITIYTAYHYSPEYLWKSLQFLKENMSRFPYAEFSDREYSLDEFPEMMLKVSRREITRAIIVPGSSNFK